jgi:hypothetical protein
MLDENNKLQIIEGNAEISFGDWDDKCMSAVKCVIPNFEGTTYKMLVPPPKLKPFYEAFVAPFD